MDNVQEKKKRKIQRSPSYPMLSLEEAIQKIKILWDKDRNKTIPTEAAYEHLGYKKIGGYASRVIAALKKFGLINEKQNDIILTDEALDLALHEPSDSIYVETVMKLAFKPTIYEKLFNEYNGNLPSDATLKIKLIKEHEFNPDKVDGFLSDFRRTIEFANLLSEQKEESDKKTEEAGNLLASIIEKQSSTSKPKAEIQMQKIQQVNDNERIIATYSIGRGQTARILISGDLTTEKSIDKLLTRMQEDKEDMIESIADEKTEATDN